MTHVSKRKSKSQNWPAYITDALKVLTPPEKLTVSEWADKYRVLDAKSSSRPGKWSNSTTPYLADIMNEFNSIETEEITFVKPTQVGGTEALQNALGYIVMQDPSPVIIVYPTDKLAESISENRLQPMLKLSPELRKRFLENRTSKLEIQCEGMYVTLVGANSPAGLSSFPIKYVLLDEIDKFPGASKKEASPIKLSKERTKTYPDRKIFQASTPTLKTGHIWKAKEGSDIEKHYYVPCPQCGDYIELMFKQIKWSQDADLSYADRAETAKYCCQKCGGIIEDRHKGAMLNQGEWRVVRRSSNSPKKVAYWMNTLYSPFVTFKEIAKEFLTTKDDPEEFQNFVNSWLAEPWEDTKLKTNAETVKERQSEIPEFTVPDWAVFLTGGVDVQETSLYYTIRAWGKHMTSQLIARGQVSSFTDIEKIMNAEFEKENGERMLVQAAGIDSGDQTDEVYDFCSRNSEWAIPVKGIPKGLHHFRISKINKTASSAYGMQLILIDGNQYKDMIASRMKKKNGSGSWMVFKGIDDDYANQVTAEHKVNEKRNGRSVQLWVPKTSHADNHYLDCEVYNFGIADFLGVRSLHLTEQQEEPEEVPDVNDQAEEYNNNWLGVGKSWL